MTAILFISIQREPRLANKLFHFNAPNRTTIAFRVSSEIPANYCQIGRRISNFKYCPYFISVSNGQSPFLPQYPGKKTFVVTLLADLTALIFTCIGDPRTSTRCTNPLRTLDRSTRSNSTIFTRAVFVTIQIK